MWIRDMDNRYVNMSLVNSIKVVQDPNNLSSYIIWVFLPSDPHTAFTTFASTTVTWTEDQAWKIADRIAEAMGSYNPFND